MKHIIPRFLWFSEWWGELHLLETINGFSQTIIQNLPILQRYRLKFMPKKVQFAKKGFRSVDVLIFIQNNYTIDVMLVV